MLATLVDKPFDEEGWSYEIKWDGFRTLSYLQEGNVEMRSRNNKIFFEIFIVPGSHFHISFVKVTQCSKAVPFYFIRPPCFVKRLVHQRSQHRFYI